MFGADTEALRAVADQFAASGDDADRVGELVSGEVEAVEWSGPDADQFRADFEEVVRTDLRALADALEAVVLHLDEQARAQDETSAAGGATAGNGAAGGPGTEARAESAAPSAPAAATTAFAQRDAELRRQLDTALAEAQRTGSPILDDLEAVRDALASTPDASLVELDLGDPERVYAAVGIGDLATAENVTYLVPGINSTVDDDFGRLMESSMNVRDAAAVEAGGALEQHAVVAWMGYDSGNPLTAPFDGKALAGAERLERSLDAFTAVRPDPTVNLAVIGHSYGSTTTAVALSDGSQHGVDRFIALGSAGFPSVRDTNGWWPGGHEIRPADFGATQVATTEAGRDWIADLGRMMPSRLDPAEMGFTTFSSEATSTLTGVGGHNLNTDGDSPGYLSPGTSSLHEVGRILNGRN